MLTSNLNPSFLSAALATTLHDIHHQTGYRKDCLCDHELIFENGDDDEAGSPNAGSTLSIGERWMIDYFEPGKEEERR